MISCQELSRNNNVASVFFALWRHLEACKLLGWTEVEVIVQSTSDAETEVLMEIAENEQRKSFSREERVNAGVELERIEKVLAEKRVEVHQFGKSTAKKNSTGPKKGQTRDIVASYLNMSGFQYEREKFIVEHKDLFPLYDGKKDIEFSAWDSGAESTNKAYTLLKAAVSGQPIKPPKPKTVEVVKEVEPEDYQTIKAANEKLTAEITALRAELATAPPLDPQNDPQAELKSLREQIAAKDERISQLENDTRTFNDAAYLERTI